jgi:hypothetical protein
VVSIGITLHGIVVLDDTPYQYLIWRVFCYLQT